MGHENGGWMNEDQRSSVIEETVPCEICGNPTRMTGTKRCDRCWELERRMQASPELARKIVLPAGTSAYTPREKTERLADLIATGFLLPACEASDYAERWKAVNRAAGVIAGSALAAPISPTVYDARTILDSAQHLTNACLRAMNDQLGMPSPHAIARDMIAGPNGLPKRVAECLLALGVNHG